MPSQSRRRDPDPDRFRLKITLTLIVSGPVVVAVITAVGGIADAVIRHLH